jgi:hypothetical protein
MPKWVYCHLCGCTGYHRDPHTNQEYPCPNGCDGGRVYEHSNREWFDRLVLNGAAIHDQVEAGLGSVPVSK